MISTEEIYKEADDINRAEYHKDEHLLKEYGYIIMRPTLKTVNVHILNQIMRDPSALTKDDLYSGLTLFGRQIFLGSRLLLFVISNKYTICLKSRGMARNYIEQI